jgi:L-fucose mutarotase
MQVVGEPLAVPVPVQEFRKALLQQGEAAPVDLERFAFYERIRVASLIVQTGESTAYGNALFCKGVILG